MSEGSFNLTINGPNVKNHLRPVPLIPRDRPQRPTGESSISVESATRVGKEIPKIAALMSSSQTEAEGRFLLTNLLTDMATSFDWGGLAVAAAAVEGADLMSRADIAHTASDAIVAAMLNTTDLEEPNRAGLLKLDSKYGEPDRLTLGGILEPGIRVSDFDTFASEPLFLMHSVGENLLGAAREGNKNLQAIVPLNGNFNPPEPTPPLEVMHAHVGGQRGCCGLETVNLKVTN